MLSRSREGAWIEIQKQFTQLVRNYSRSREGAWIEIPAWENGKDYSQVAPVRERGLKCNHAVPRLKNLSRSREGAWIEIATVVMSAVACSVAPVRERGLKYWQ